MHENNTDLQLLAKLRDPANVRAWEEFVAIYRPAIYRLGRRFGLQDADAQNLVQQVLCKLADQVRQWESGRPEYGFRRWLTVVAKNAAVDAVRRIRPDAGIGGSSILQAVHELPAIADRKTEVARELERQAFRWAAERIRCEFTDATWIAFWETMVEGRPCERVAEELGKSIGAIYTARSRVMQRLKTEVELFDWQQAEAEMENHREFRGDMS